MRLFVLLLSAALLRPVVAMLPAALAAPPAAAPSPTAASLLQDLIVGAATATALMCGPLFLAAATPVSLRLRLAEDNSTLCWETSPSAAPVDTLSTWLAAAAARLPSLSALDTLGYSAGASMLEIGWFTTPHARSLILIAEQNPPRAHLVLLPMTCSSGWLRDRVWSLKKVHSRYSLKSINLAKSNFSFIYGRPLWQSALSAGAPAALQAVMLLSSDAPLPPAAAAHIARSNLDAVAPQRALVPPRREKQLPPADLLTHALELQLLGYRPAAPFAEDMADVCQDVRAVQRALNVAATGIGYVPLGLGSGGGGGGGAPAPPEFVREPSPDEVMAHVSLSLHVEPAAEAVQSWLQKEGAARAEEAAVQAATASLRTYPPSKHVGDNAVFLADCFKDLDGTQNACYASEQGLELYLLQQLRDTPLPPDVSARLADCNKGLSAALASVDSPGGSVLKGLVSSTIIAANPGLAGKVGGAAPDIAGVARALRANRTSTSNTLAKNVEFLQSRVMPDAVQLLHGLFAWASRVFPAVAAACSSTGANFRAAGARWAGKKDFPTLARELVGSAAIEGVYLALHNPSGSSGQPLSLLVACSHTVLNNALRDVFAASLFLSPSGNAKLLSFFSAYGDETVNATGGVLLHLAAVLLVAQRGELTKMNADQPMILAKSVRLYRVAHRPSPAPAAAWLRFKTNRPAPRPPRRSSPPPLPGRPAQCAVHLKEVRPRHPPRLLRRLWPCLQRARGRRAACRGAYGVCKPCGPYSRSASGPAVTQLRGRGAAVSRARGWRGGDAWLARGFVGPPRQPRAAAWRARCCCAGGAAAATRGRRSQRRGSANPRGAPAARRFASFFARQCVRFPPFWTARLHLL